MCKGRIKPVRKRMPWLPFILAAVIWPFSLSDHDSACRWRKFWQRGA